MVFDNTYTPSDILSIVSLVLVIIGGIFTYYQWRKTVLIKRASYINELTEKIRSDPDIKYIVYLFDYDQDWYSASFHENKVLEIQVDKTLSYFSYICYLKKQNIISKKEFKFFQYEVERILMNLGVQNYFFNLYHFAAQNNVPFTFVYLLDYGKAHNLLNNDFFDSTSPLFPHYLNF